MVDSIPVDYAEMAAGIDWRNPDAHISPHFTVRDACYLPNWSALHYPTEEEKVAIIKTAREVAEPVRAFLGNEPLTITSWLRPAVANISSPLYHGGNYNKAIGGALHSCHIPGWAIDFIHRTLPCDEVRHRLLPELERMGLCMEHLDGSGWVHVDRGDVAVHGVRYFRP